MGVGAGVGGTGTGTGMITPTRVSKRPVSMYAGLQNLNLKIPDRTSPSRGSAAGSAGGSSNGSGNKSASVSPLEGLHGFERMSLGAGAAGGAGREEDQMERVIRERERQRERERERDGRERQYEPWPKRVKKEDDPSTQTTAAQMREPARTLVAAYTYDAELAREEKRGVKVCFFFFCCG